MLMLALPGSAYLYQGEELGLPEHTEMPDRRSRQDPNWVRKGYTERGRDGCRVPLPWIWPVRWRSASGRRGRWLPQPDRYGRYARDLQEVEPDLDPRLYRAALALRRVRSLATVSWSGPVEPGQRGAGVSAR